MKASMPAGRRRLAKSGVATVAMGVLLAGCGSTSSTSPTSAAAVVILPLAVPGLATTAILVFISVWNEFLLAVTLTTSPESRPVPVAIAFFNGTSEYDQPIGAISAASVLITIPLVILVLVCQKRIVAGMTAGAVKG